MKNIKIFIIILLSNLSFSQNKERQIVYLYFDSTSEKKYSVEVNGRTIKEKYYNKGVKKNGNITFYIGKEMLSFNNKEIDTCKIQYLENIKISNIKDLKKVVNKENPLYPFKVFPNLFLIEKINDSTIVKYRVKWEYYIE